MKQFYIDPQMLLGGIVYTAPKQEIVHLSLKKGNTVPEYFWPAEINLFVIEGEVNLFTEAETRLLKTRELVVLDPNTRHHLVAITDAQILAVKLK